MLIPILGVKFILNAIQEGIFMLIAIHGLKLCTQLYT